MPKSTEYEQFVKFQRSTEPDDLPKKLVTTASHKEIGFWKHYQFARAVRHARLGIATPVELHLTAKKEVLYPESPKDLRIKARRKHPQKLQREFLDER